MFRIFISQQYKQMVKISSNSEMVPRENSPNLVKLAWNDPCQNAGSDEDDYRIVVPNDTKYLSPFSGTYF